MPREQVIRAVTRGGPERIPCWYRWIADETWEKYGERLRRALDQYSDDIVLADYDMPAGFVELAPGRDEFTIYYVSIPGVFSGMRSSDLQGDWDKLERYLDPFPDPSAPGRFNTAKRLRAENPDYYLVGHWWATFTERMMALRGAENFFMDLALERKRLAQLGEKICDFFCGIVDGFAEAGMDGIFFSDDLGVSDSLMFSPDTFRSLFKPWYKRLFERIRSHNMIVMMHSCGYIWEIIPDLIECGLKVLHFQPSVLQPERLVREFGDDLSFFGGIDIQRFLINSTPWQVRDGIKRLFSILDRAGGGYIAGPSNSLMPDTPFENIEAMLDAMWEYGLRASKAA